MRFKDKMILLLISVLSIKFSYGCDSDACEYNCIIGHEEHIKSNKCSSLGRLTLRQGLTKEEELVILWKHNDLRTKIANGSEIRGSPGPQPATKLKYMTELTWNKGLAMAAQKFANRCDSGFICKRSMSAGMSTGNTSKPWHFEMTDSQNDFKEYESIVQRWYDDYIDLWNNTNTYKNYIDSYIPGLDFTKFTQLIWNKTGAVGCGAIKYAEQQLKYYYLVCYYFPSGNIVGQQIYEPIMLEGTEATPNQSNFPTLQLNFPLDAKAYTKHYKNDKMVKAILPKNTICFKVYLENVDTPISHCMPYYAKYRYHYVKDHTLTYNYWVPQDYQHSEKL